MSQEQRRILFTHISLLWPQPLKSIDNSKAMKQHIQELIEKTIQAHTVVEVIVDGLPIASGRFQARPQALDRNHVVMEVTRGVEPSPEWKNRLCTCRFKAFFEPDTQSPSFCGFISHIDDIRAEGEANQILVRIPSRIESKERRRHVRVTPPRDLVGKIILWNALPAANPASTDPKRWSAPLINHSPADGDQVVLRDLSAGGFRLRLTGGLAQAQPFPFTVGKRYFVFFALKGVPGASPVRLWLTAMARNIIDMSGSRGMEVGFQSIGVGTPEEMLLTWRKAAKKGVPALDDWTHKLNMELYRGAS